MPRRDPETGQFLSSSGSGAGRPRQITATYTSHIPAADLGGGNLFKRVAGDEARIIDWTEFLHSDEVFVLDEVQGRAILDGPTTATAEGTVGLEYAINRGFGRVATLQSSTFWGTPDVEDGIVDITRDSTDDDPQALWVAHMRAHPSLADSAAGLAGGGDVDRNEIYRVFGDQPRFDADDEIVVPHDWQVDNVSDHAVEFALTLALQGRVQELD